VNSPPGGGLRRGELSHGDTEHLGHRRRAVVTPIADVERAEEDRVQRGREQDPARHTHRLGAAGIGQPFAAQHRGPQRPDREDVGPVVAGAAAEPLGRDEALGPPEHHARRCIGRRQHEALVLLDHARVAEIEEAAALGAVLDLDHAVARRDVAVRHAAGVQRGEPAQQVEHDRHRALPRHRVLGDLLGDASPLDELEHAVASFEPADVVGAHEARVMDLRGDLGLLDESADDVRVLVVLRVEHLDRDLGLGRRVRGGVDRRRAAVADPVLELVAPPERLVREVVVDRETSCEVEVLGDGHG
jgi:hypothetical protein